MMTQFTPSGNEALRARTKEAKIQHDEITIVGLHLQELDHNIFVYFYPQAKASTCRFPSSKSNLIDEIPDHAT